MRILLVIDHLGPGGAQRQLAALAEGLHRAGDHVEIVTYFSGQEFFVPGLAKLGVPIHLFLKGSRYAIRRPVLGLTGLLRSGKYDVALSYLSTPSIYLELASILCRAPTVIVVSERSSHHLESRPWLFWALRQLHRRADMVVANSRAHGSWLRASHSWLADKVAIIHNGTSAEFFSAKTDVPMRSSIKLLAVGRISHEKNVHGLLEGLSLFGKKTGWMPRVTWVGPLTEQTEIDVDYRARIDKILGQNPELAESVSFVGMKENVAELLAEHDTLVHPSFVEGFPNVVCEALAAGRPVLASDIADNKFLIGDSERGRLFNPHSPASIADAIAWLADRAAPERAQLSLECSRFAKNNLSVDMLVQNYRDLFLALLQRRTRAARV